jgi:peptidoglycan/LPS O-acetylase OafA/YrhL
MKQIKCLTSLRFFAAAGRIQSVFGSFPAFGLLIGVLSFERGIVSRFLSGGWLVILGEISYSIYLVHQILSRWYMLNPSMFASVPKAMLYIAYWLAVLSLSFVICRAVEKPCQRWIRSRFGAKREAMSITVGVPTIINS